MVEISVIIAVVIGLSEVVKKMELLPVKLIPLLNLVIAIMASLIWSYDQDWRAAVLQGVIAGLSASGLYSGAKNVIQGVTGNDGK